MRRMEMLDAYHELGIRGQRYRTAKEGEKIETKKGTFTICNIDHGNGEDPNFCEILICNGEEKILLDCSPHWDRGPEGDIKFCHDGVVNLIHAVYQQVEKDYEELFISKDVKLARGLMEDEKDFRKRKKYEYERAMKECEDFLGSVLVKFAKIRAMWNIGMSPESIAHTLGETEERICAIIDRLGLANKPKDYDDEFDI